MKRFIVLLPPLLFMALGCSTFRSSKRLDLSPFANYTVDLAADIEFGMTKGTRVHYLMEYRSDPVVRAHNERWNQVRQLVRGIVSYSVEVTTLGSSQLSEKERNARFSLFLDRLVRPVIQDNPSVIHMSEAGLDSILAGIRAEKSFLGALGEAQPVIDEASRIAELVLDDVQDSLDHTAEYLRERIRQENANVIFVRKALLAGQERVVNSIQLLSRYRAGDKSVLPELLENEPQLHAYLPTHREPTFEEIQNAEDRLLFLMEKAVDFKEQFAPDMQYYRNQVLELDDLYSNAMLHLKKARVTIIVWARAHRDLSTGVTDPAKIDLFDVAKKAMKTVM